MILNFEYIYVDWEFVKIIFKPTNSALSGGGGRGFAVRDCVSYLKNIFQMKKSLQFLIIEVKNLNFKM